MTTDLADALCQEKIRCLIKKLRRRLDSTDGAFSKDSYENEVEDDFWQAITGQEDPGDEIEYQSLPDDAKGVVGHDEDGELPWWFESFEWTFRGFGSGALTVGDDDLETLESFDPQNTRVEKPQLTGDSRGWISLLDSLDQLRTELVTQTEFDESSIHVSPDEYEPFDGRIFELRRGTVRTTKDFRDWAEGRLELCPPATRRRRRYCGSILGYRSRGCEAFFRTTSIVSIELVSFRTRWSRTRRTARRSPGS